MCTLSEAAVKARRQGAIFDADNVDTTRLPKGIATVLRVPANAGYIR
jgi:hypothetical protein